MTKGVQRFTKRYVNVLGVLIGLAVVSSILLYSGCGMTSSPNIRTNPTPTPDNVRPTSTITSPTTGTIVSTTSTVNITGTASDAGGGTVQSVQVSVDGGVTWNPATGTTAWSYAWLPTQSGPTMIRSRAIDNSGNAQEPTAEVTVIVQDRTLPTSAITSPTAGETIFTGATFTITGTGSDTGGGSVQVVEVSVDGGATWNPAVGTRAWAYFWSPSLAGPAKIKSRATDSSGNVQDPPTEVSVTVVDPPDTTPPTVTPFFPAAGADDVGIRIIIKAFFSEKMDPATVIGSTVELLDQSDAPIRVIVNYTPSDSGLEMSSIEPLSTGTTYTVRVKGGDTDPRVKDLAGNAMAADRTWTFTTGLPPRVLSTTPMDGDLDILTGVALRVTFSKDISLSSLRSSGAVLLQDSEKNQISFNVLPTFGVSPSTVVIVPFRMLSPLQTYTVTFKGGINGPHVTDLVDIPMESDYKWSFTTAAEPPPMAIFAPDDWPLNTVPDLKATEVGLKFRSDVDGVITGVRFHKRGPENGGEHVGNLWTRDGTLLGSVTFTDETESGWQHAFFQSPIPITADTTYVVSYFAPQGHYSYTRRQFESAGIDTKPLHALQDGEDGGNGVFIRSPTGEFPTETDRSTNYWVDVVFGDPTLSAPQVLSTTPPHGWNIAFFDETSTFTITFSEPIDTASVNDSTVMLIDAVGAPIPFTISFVAGNFTVILTPQQPLLEGEAYTVTLKGGVNAPHITDATGTPLAADFTWSITKLFR